jgi:hypothetical protein
MDEELSIKSDEAYRLAIRLSEMTEGRPTSNRG